MKGGKVCLEELQRLVLCYSLRLAQTAWRSDFTFTLHSAWLLPLPLVLQGIDYGLLAPRSSPHQASVFRSIV